VKAVRIDPMRLAIAALVLAALATPAPGGANYPSPTPAWGAAQYVDFYFVHRDGHQALPHLRSDEGRRLVARLTDRGNIARILASPASAEEKRQLLSLIAMSIGEVRGAYAVSELVGEPLAEELARVQAFQLHVIARRAELGGEALPVSAWRTAVLGVAQSLTEDQRYSESQRALLGSAIAGDYRVFAPLLDRRQSSELARLASELGGRARGRELRRAMGRLVQVIEEARAE
jgi:hypothetical protein